MSQKCELTGVKPLKGHKVSHANNKAKRKFLPNLKIVVGLGKIGFESFLHYTRNNHELKMKDYPFKHGVGYALPSGITLYGAYHPSPRNVNTKRITFDMMVAFLKQLKNEI